MRLKDSFSLAIEYTTWYHICLDTFSLEVKNAIFNVFNPLHLLTCLSHEVVLLCERMVHELSLLLQWLFNDNRVNRRNFIHFAVFHVSHLFHLTEALVNITHLLFTLFLFRLGPFFLTGFFPGFFSLKSGFLSCQLGGSLACFVWAYNLLHLPSCLIPCKKWADKDKYSLSRSFFTFGCWLWESFQSCLNITRVSKVQVIYDQVTLGQILHSKARFRALNKLVTVNNLPWASS